ncbi:MAG: O-antigen ligase family protein [Hyphomonadaceae bacterium]|nr:O-antigen ligase family protein [Hyphomonadaceae bacterium]
MTVIAGVVLAIVALYAVSDRNSVGHRLELFLAILLVAGQFLLVEQSVANFPIRVGIFVAASAYLAHAYLAGRPSILRSPDGAAIAWSWLLFSVVVLMCLAANGSLREIADYQDFVSRFGYSFVSFAVIGSAARRSPTTLFVCLFSLALANFAFVVSQAAGIRWADVIQSQLFPATQVREELMISEGLNSSFGYLPGLSSYSIVTGYVFSVFGILGFGLATLARSPVTRLAGSMSAILIILVGGALIYSRSTLLVGAVIGGALLWRNHRSAVRIVYLALLAIVFATQLAPLQQAATDASNWMPGISRIANFDDPRRAQLIETAFRLFGDHPVFGTNEYDREMAGVGIGAHNVFLNALVTTGIVGLSAMSWFLWTSLRSGVRAIARVRPEQRGLAVAAFAAMLAYLVKSLVHNESLITSGIMYMMVCGVLFGLGNAPHAASRRPA